eukprot:763410-Hanusia_phi.AAC.1
MSIPRPPLSSLSIALEKPFSCRLYMSIASIAACLRSSLTSEIFSSLPLLLSALRLRVFSSSFSSSACCSPPPPSGSRLLMLEGGALWSSPPRRHRGADASALLPLRSHLSRAHNRNLRAAMARKSRGGGATNLPVHLPAA